jgi:prepilin-type N-terminal cleavage/methylation domain-containing protein
MKQKSHSIKGVTLLEVMLVLAIAATLIVMSFQFFYRYRTQNAYDQIKNNVDTLFEGMRRFFYVNCQEGVLSPLHNPAPSLNDPFSIDIKTLLIDKSFLSTTWPIESSRTDIAYAYQGYSAKFIPKQIETGRKMTACYNFNDSKGVQCYEGKIDYPQNIILNWQMQVVVKMTTWNEAQALYIYLGANCVKKDAPSDTTPVDCSSSDSDGEYVVFLSMPSISSSDLSMTMPVVKNFNLLYTHDPMYELYNRNIGTGTDSTDKKYRYYLCGG